MKALKRRIDAILPGLMEFRHDIHAHPEVGFNEFRTSSKILEELRKIDGLSIKSGIARTGIAATLFAEKSGPCVMLRADMDALPIKEETGLPYASRSAGVAHACGHDGHITCLLGAARLLSEMGDALRGPVKFVFQPAEEGLGGARVMCDEGVLEEPVVSAAFALHGWPALPLGTVGVRTGAIMASTDAIDMVVRGRGSHAAEPHEGADPIVAASYIIVGLQGAVARNLPPSEPAVVTIGAVNGGTASNVIPDSVEMMGTIRAISEETRATAVGSVRRIVEGAAAAYGVVADLELTPGYPVTVNAPETTDIMRGAASRALGEDALREVPVSLVGEDFAFYARRVPATMWLLGVGDPALDEQVPLHNPRYNFPDAAIPLGVLMHCVNALEFNKKEIE